MSEICILCSVTDRTQLSSSIMAVFSSYLVLMYYLSVVHKLSFYMQRYNVQLLTLLLYFHPLASVIVRLLFTRKTCFLAHVYI